MDADTHTLLQKTANLAHHHHIGSEEGLFEFGLSTGIDSRYVSEGRDNLPGKVGCIGVERLAIRTPSAEPFLQRFLG